MAAYRRLLVAPLLALALTTPARSQPSDPDRVHRLSREALTLYWQALIQQRPDRLADAVRILEEVVRLDPEAVPPRQALVPLYSALGRTGDAARAAAAVLAIDPSQADVWRTLARLLHGLRRTPEAVATLERCVAAPQMADRPADLIAAYCDLGRLHAALGAHDRAADSYREALKLVPALQARGVGEDERNRQRGELSEGLGSSELAAGQFANAASAFDEARASYRLAGEEPRRDRLTAALAAAYAGLGQATKATALLDPYLRMMPRDLDAYTLKVRLLREAGAATSVPEILRTYARANPAFSELHVLLGDECRRLGDRVGAERAYRDANTRKANVAAYRGLFALLAAPDGSPQRLFALLGDAVGRADLADDGKPRNPGAAEHVRAMTLALAKEPAAARALLNAAVTELRPRRGFGRNPQLDQDQLRRYYLWWLLAGVAERAGLLGQAEELCQTSLRDVRRGGADEVAIQEALLRVLWADRKRQDVIRVCEAGLARAEAPVPVLLYANLARAEVQTGKVQEALRHADAAVEKANDANRLTAQLLHVELLAYAERYDDAEAEGLKLLQTYFKSEEVRRIRLALSRDSTARRFDKSEEHLRLILELDPSDANAHNELGYQLADLNRRLDEAERLVRRALELDRLQKSDSLEDAGENAAYLDSLAWVLFRRGRFGEARELLERVVAQPEGAGDPVVWDHLGDVCARLGRAPDAATAWSRARELCRTEKHWLHDPRGDDVERKLQRLKQSD